jgi:hypothetical protein
MSIALPAILSAACNGGSTPEQPSPGLVISNLRSNVLGSYDDLCGRDSGVTVTQFTFDFTVSGLDLRNKDASVYRIGSSGGATTVDEIAPISLCSSGPCAATPHACITAGQSDGTGTIELAATETFRAESTWTLEVRQKGDAGLKSNPLSTTVHYASPE